MTTNAMVSRKRSRQKAKVPSILLAKIWKYAVPFALTTFPIFTLTIYQIINWYYKNNHIYCEPILAVEWEQDLRLILVGASGSAMLILVARFIMAVSTRKISSNITAVYATVLAVMTINFSGEYLKYLNTFTFMCEDVFGVRSPMIQISEWQSTVPLMIFLNVTLDTQKEELSWKDLSLVLAGYLGIVICLVPIASSSLLLGSISIFLSCAFFLYVGVANAGDAWKGFSKALHECELGPLQLITFNISLRRLRSATLLNIIFSIFAIIYFLRTLQFISHDAAFTLFSLSNFLTKDVFTLFLLEGHLEVLDPSLFLLLTEKEANVSRRMFIRYVFHEIRSPLNALVMGAQVLKEGAAENMPAWADGFETLNMMSESTAYMNETLNDILYVQDVEELALDLVLLQRKLLDMLTEVITSFVELLNVKGIRFVLEIAADVPTTILCDGVLMQLAISNVVSNAIKFSDNGKRVQLSITRIVSTDKPQSDLPSEYVLVKVADQGNGISPNDQQHLFKMYSALRTGEVKSGRGAGVGLAISKEIVCAHGGTIWLDSTGQTSGSVFCFTIPVRSDDAAVKNTIKDLMVEKALLSDRKDEYYHEFVPSVTDDIITMGVDARTPCVPGTLKEQARFLIVDDVLSNRSMLDLLLRNRGLESNSAEDAEMAINMALHDRANYEVIFMDNMMPYKNGVAACKILREKGYKNLIIGVTGNTDTNDIFEFEDAGADVVFIKPMSVKKLDSVLAYLNDKGPASTVKSRNLLQPNGSRFNAFEDELTEYMLRGSSHGDLGNPR